MKKTAYLGLGSNLGDREANLHRALESLEERKVHIKRVAAFRNTKPAGPVQNQPDFLNTVAEVETELFPMQLLRTALDIERRLGRKRLVAQGPRIIDIDILLYGRFVVDTPQLIIPHARMTERRFVLEPMVELAPELRHPVLRKTMRELLAAVDRASRRQP